MQSATSRPCLASPHRPYLPNQEMPRTQNAARLACAAVLPALTGAVMNAGGVPYAIGNPAPTGTYSTEFEKESPQYFDVYAEVQTRYSQVYWTNSGPLPLPQEIVDKFAGKVMAITGYEVDQVMNPHVVNATCHTAECRAADRSIPIYNAYNHHYFGWLTGVHGEMYQMDEAKVGMNPTKWDARYAARHHDQALPHRTRHAVPARVYARVKRILTPACSCRPRTRRLLSFSVVV